MHTQPYRPSLLLAVAIPALQLLSLSAPGLTYTVMNAADSGAGSLRQAILDANANGGADIVNFDATFFGSTPRTITLTSGVLSITGSLTINGPASPGKVTLDGGNITRIMSVSSGANLTVDKITFFQGRLTGAQTGDGAAIQALGTGTLTATNCVFQANENILSGGHGGAVYLDKDGVFTSCTFHDNNALGNAGALAIGNDSPSCRITSCVFTANTSDLGGAIHAFVASGVKIYNSTFSGNSVTNQGGAILNFGSDITLTNVTLSGNQAASDGGAIAQFSSGTLTLRSVTIANNTADSDNNTSGNGGGIFHSAGTVAFENTIVATNIDSGGGTSHPDVSSTGGTLTTNGYNLLGNNTGSGLAAGNPTPANDKIGTSASPINPNLAALANNGGPTQTHAFSGSSPAKNSGNNGFITAAKFPDPPFTGGTFTDQRGTGFTRISHGTVDMGAFEEFSSDQPPVASNVNANSLSQPLKVGATLTGSYSYSDAENAAQGTSTFRWLRADNAAGLNETVISGEIAISYILTSLDLNKYITFEVTPVAAAGATPGIAAPSPRVGPIAASDSTATTITTQTPNPSVFGQSVSLAATVTNTTSGVTPNAGTVEFREGVNVLAAPTVNGSGVATVNLNTLTAGAHNIVAYYMGGSFFGPSNSGVSNQNVNKANTTTTITAHTPDPSNFGANVAITAQVVRQTPVVPDLTGPPPGTVEFFADGNSLGSPVALSGNPASATINVTSLAIGTRSLTASYVESANFNASSSSAVSHTVNAGGATVVAITASDSSADENTGGTGAYQITRSSGAGTLTVNLTASGTGVAADYSLSGAGVAGTHPNYTVSFGAGVTSLNLTLTPTNDVHAEAAETAIMTVVAGAGYGIDPANTAATVTIGLNDFVVVTNAGSGEGSLRQAVLNANAIAGTDTITFTTTPIAPFNVDFDASALSILLGGTSYVVTQSVTINGPALPGVLTLDAALLSRIFDVSGSGVIVSIDRLTLYRGRHPVGGGDGAAVITGAGVTFNASNCSFTNNQTSSGGNGGAVFLGQHGEFTNCVFSNNTALDGKGGALAVTSGTVTVRGTNNSFTGNTATNGGGAVFIYNSNNPGLYIYNSTFSGNSTPADGGAIINTGGTIYLTNVTLSGNSAAANGGAYAATDGSLYLRHATVTANIADSDNNGTGDGGGLYGSAGAIDVANSIVAANFDTPGNAGGGTIHADITQAGSAATTSMGKSVIGDNTSVSPTFPAGLPNANGDKVGTSGARLNPMLQALGNFGGPTLTHALQAGSPARDMGNNAHVNTTNFPDPPFPGGVFTDQRGPGFARISNGTVDAGAFETQSADQLPVASSVTFSGQLKVGATLTGSYSYSDGDGDLQNVPGRIIRWLRSDNAAGLNEAAISGATSITYILAAADLNKYISFEIAPAALTGASPGLPVASPRQGAVANSDSTSTAFTSNSPSPSRYGQPITLVATVTNTSGPSVPTGTVEFREGLTVIASAALESGVATANNVIPGPVGPHTLRAYYLGGGVFLASQSGTVTQQVTKSDTSIVTGHSPSTSSFGDPVTITGTVTATSPGGLTPAGTVEFFNDGNSLGTATLNGSGVASISVSTLPLGIRSLTSTYLGNDNYNGSTSAAVSHTVLAGGTTVVGITTTDASADENTGNTGTWQLTRNSTTNALTVNLAASGTTTAADFTITGGSISGAHPNFTIQFGAGAGTVNLTLNPVNDTHAEANETAVLALAASVNYAIDPANSSATVTIGLNDLLVANTNSGGEGSLRQAVLNANAISGTDTILFATTPIAPWNVDFDAGPQTIHLNTPNVLGEMVATESLILNSPSAPGAITIDGDSESRVLHAVGAGITLTMDRVTIRGGLPRLADGPEPGGGGLLMEDGSVLTATNCVFTSNLSRFGGAGGGVSLSDDGTLTSCVFSSNTAQGGKGGGLSAQGDNVVVTVKNCSFTGNSATGGGGMYTYVLSPGIFVYNSTFSGNTVTEDGGGLISGKSEVILANSTISGNTAGRHGGGYASENYGHFHMHNVTVTGNTADSDSNGVGDGGGCWFDSGTIQMENTIVAANIDASPATIIPDICLSLNPTVNPKPQVTGRVRCLIGNNAGIAIHPDTLVPIFPAGLPNANGDWVGTPAAPLNPLLGALANNGGPTLTHLPQAGSSAINNGANAEITAARFPSTIYPGGVTDQRGPGFHRIFNATVDIGAVEAQSPNNLPAASNVTFTGQLRDGALLTGSYTRTDPENDPEGGASSFRWYRSDNAGGTNKAAISGATSQTYTLVAADVGKFISFEVTPGSSTGSTPGPAVESSRQGPIAAKFTTTTSVVSSLSPSVAFQPVTLTATVTSGGGTPGGSVRFQIDIRAPIDVALNPSGQASTIINDFSATTHTITAEYLGAGVFAGSVSTPISQIVNKASTAAALTDTPDPSAVGANVTLTATVTSVTPSVGTPDGEVEFLEGVTLLHTATLSGGTATFNTSSLSAGVHNLTVFYKGSGNYLTSISPVNQHTVGAGGYTYNDWKATSFPSTPANLQDPCDDPDNDGWANDMEFIMGTNPETYSADRVSVVSTPTTSTFSYVRRKAIASGYETREYSTNLTTWAADGGITPTTAPYAPDPTNYDVISVTVNDPRRFFRVRGQTCE